MGGIFQKIKENTDGMSGKEKLSYILTYYWYHLLGIVAVLGLIVFLVVHFAFPEEKPLFTCALVNQRIDSSRDQKLAEDFAESVKEQSKPMPILRADKAFHSYILEMAGNEYITDFCDIRWIHIQRLEYGFFRDTPMEESIDEHEKLIQVLEMKDSYSASLLAKAHWDRTALMLKELNKRDD